MSLLISLLMSLLVSACNAVTSTQALEEASATPTPTPALFAGDTKGVKVNMWQTKDKASFNASDISAYSGASVTIPDGFPGAGNGNAYVRGIRPRKLYALDDSELGVAPAWLQSFEVKTKGDCANFGGIGDYDVENTYRVSEIDCASVMNPEGKKSTSNDEVQIQIVLNRDSNKIGTQENLLVTIEYQASGLHFNSVKLSGSNNDPEENADFVWKVFWDNTLLPTSLSKVFSTLVPPVFSACEPSGGTTPAAPGSNPCNSGNSIPYKGAAIQKKQILIPLSAYPDLSVIRLSRTRGQVNHAAVAPGISGAAFLNNFCVGTASAKSPLCAGMVIHSITLLRI